MYGMLKDNFQNINLTENEQERMINELNNIQNTEA